MINKILNEEMVIGVIKNILEEETSKVNRNDYSKVQFKMEELENQLVETIKELRKVEDSIPDGLKTLSDNRLKSISSCLYDAHNTLKQLKNKVREHKKSSYRQQVNEKKK
jgi:DNA-binding MltR family transcriptional regulator